MASILEKVLRTGDKKVLRRLRSYADAINTLEDGFRKFTDAELRAETDAFRQRLEDERMRQRDEQGDPQGPGDGQRTHFLCESHVQAPLL
mgnify:CR=1 FL=1